MRIRKISFSNINNLKGGPHVISFEEEPLKSSGIFAITGPTGSGKSTILDVITLALFNRIPRYDGKISDKKMQELGSVITHHAKDAEAAVEYEVGGNRYTSKWSVHLAKNSGKIQPYDMSISDVSGNYLDLKRSDVPAKNEEIIGLDYEQFVKSIILSQGEFSKFLKSTVNERGKLLEKLTGGDVYRKISQAAYRKEKDIVQQLKFEKSLFAEIELFTPEKIEEVKKNIDLYQKEISKLEQVIKNDVEVLQVKTSLSSISKQLIEKKEKLLLNQKSLDAFQEKAEQVKVHEKVVVFSGQLSLHEKSSELLLRTASEIKARQQELNLAQERFTNSIKELGSLTKEKVEESNFKTILDTFESKVVALDFELLNLKKKGGESREKINEKLLNSRLGLNAKISPNEALTSLAEIKEKLTSQLSSIGFYENTPTSDLKTQIKDKQEKITLYRNWLQLSESQEKNLATKATLTQKIKEDQKTLESNNPLLASNLALIKSLKSQITLLEARRDDALKIAKLEDFRKELVDGEACPLCGAVDHPYTVHLPEEQENEIKKAISLNQQEIENVEQVARQLEQKISTANTAIKINSETLANLSSSISEHEKAINEIAQKFSAKQDHEPLSLKSEIQVEEKAIAALENGLESLEQLKIVNDLNLDFQNLKELLSTYASVNAQRQELYIGKDIKQETNKLQDLFTQNKSLIAKLSEFLEEKQKQYLNLENDISKIEEELKPELNNFGVPDIQSMKTLLLPQYSYEAYKKEETAIHDERKNLLAEQNQLESSQKELKEKDNAVDKEIEVIQSEIKINETRRNELNAEIGGLKSMLKEDSDRRVKQMDRQKNIEKLEEENEKWSLLSRLIGSANGDKFSNFAQGLTLQNLLVFTNRRLKNLTDRYLLDKPGPDGTLSVIDLYQGNTERAVTTLSGGEIFILSLALALSLSDMASRNVSLESLFIDEGFGTLDQETLDIAMTTLEKLQSESKKMVGIISHVEALKERINVQIQLKKNAQGYSRIEIVS
ncbi:AAA family ATPase [Portibacter lacus]|uniref:Nuclease SbcCD subunit C n=1 Tax=Portibacter lacus TaxID=1099794 RepID=A0AA37WD15_9BACT|nr:SbcC/MukB-like Walker B domain-containing protein [Portibacter lacus]GLR17441.1 nuclease SbcCD subunit C [Portibacter lacus]